jgi:AraC-like DNA-binding protein
MSTDTRVLKMVVNKQLHQIRTISDLAQLVGSSPEALKKQFKRREGVSIAKYIRGVCIELAKEILMKTNRRCKEICLAIGFSREDIGSRVFKRDTGISMKDFRKSVKRYEESEVFTRQHAK